jgi:hypothetical protein
MTLGYVDFGLDTSSQTSPLTMSIADYDADGAPALADMSRLSAPLSSILTQELEGSRQGLGLEIEVFLLAALGRAIERVIGARMSLVDVSMSHRPAGRRQLVLECVSAADVDATRLLRAVNLTYGEARRGAPAWQSADVLLSCAAGAARDVHPQMGHALELHAYRQVGVLQLDWWYDDRRFAPYTIEELSEQFALAIIELSSEAVSEVGMPGPVVVVG